MTENKPEKKFRAGAITATVWANKVEKDGVPAEYKSISFERSYKLKDKDEWKKTSNLRVQDIPKAVLVLNKAFEYVSLSESDNVVIEGA